MDSIQSLSNGLGNEQNNLASLLISLVIAVATGGKALVLFLFATLYSMAVAVHTE